MTKQYTPGNSALRTYVLYHANCFDGTGAKLAAWLRFGDRASYIPVQYGKPFPEEVPLDKNTELFILDFSYSRDVLDDIYSKVGNLMVLDHHKTAQAELAGAPYAEFDMNRSGAVMAFEYFHPGSHVPMLLQYVQDGDLWRFDMAWTEEIRAALPLLKGDMGQWARICEGDFSDGTDLADLINSGSAILASNIIKVEGTVKNNVKVLPYKGHRVGVCNTTTLVSEIGNAIYDDEKLNVDFSMTYFFDVDGTPVVSFRSKNDMDVSVLAKELGGGGHKTAAGAKVDLDFIRKLYAGEL